MEWFTGRHMYFLYPEDLSIGLSLLQLVMYFQIGYSQVAKNSTVGAAVLFIVSLFFFVLVRMSKATRLHIEPFVVPIVSAITIATGQLMHFATSYVSPMYAILVVFVFIQTGYPYIVILFYTVAGILLGTFMQLLLETSLPLPNGSKSQYDAIEHIVPLMYIILGTMVYRIVHQVGLQIVRHKRYPVKSMEPFRDLAVLERLVLPPAYHQPPPRRGGYDKGQEKGQASDSGSNVEYMEAKDNQIPSSDEGSSVDDLSRRTSNLDEYTQGDWRPRKPDTHDSKFRVLMQTEALQKYVNTLPHFLQSGLRLLDYGVDTYRKKRYIMEKAVWKRKPSRVPEQDLLGNYYDEKLENWYVQWLQMFNCDLYLKLRWVYVFLVLWSVIFALLARVQVHNFLTQMRVKEVPRFTDVGAAALRLCLQAGLQGAACLPVFIYRKELKKNQEAHYINWLFLFQGMMTFTFALWDMREFELIPNVYQGRFSSMTFPTLGISICSLFLLLRLPSYLLFCITGLVAYNLLFWLTTTNGILVMYIMKMVHYALVTVVTFFIMVRSIEHNRRRIFVKFILPYMCYLEELAMMIYSSNECYMSQEAL